MKKSAVAITDAVFWAVVEAVGVTVDKAVAEAVDEAVYWIVVEAIDGAVDEAVGGAVDEAVEQFLATKGQPDEKTH